ncbi:MAG: VWA domain-containing protein [Defluviitaleaceae bacterium]|nr:VWA domain-containing protein [Defluviitaleaceae bacterium]
MELIRKKIIKFFCFAMIVSVLAGVFPAHTLQASDVGVDVIIVLDCSGSMRWTDPDKFTISGTNLLIDQFNKDTTRFGVVMFAGEINHVLPLQHLTNESLISNLKAAISRDYSQNGARTDTVRAVDRALKEFQDSAKVGNRQVVVLFTDGMEDPVRQMSELENERDYIRRRAAEMGIPVHIIALNDQRTSYVIPDKDIAILKETAQMTNGIFKEISQANQIEQTMNEVYQQIIQATGSGTIVVFDGQQQDFIIQIPDSYILNANFNVISSSTIVIEKITAPDGTNVMNDTNRVYMSQVQNRYATVQLIQPRQKGNWTVTLRGEAGTQGTTDYTYLYTLIAAQDAVNGTGGPDVSEGSAWLRTWLATDVGRVSDLDIYDNVTGVFFEVKFQDGTTQTLNAVRNGDHYAADANHLAEGTYEVKATIIHRHFEREALDWLGVSVGPPAAGSPTSAPANPTSPANSPTPRPPATPREPFPWLMVGIIAGGALVLGLLVFVVLKLLGGSSIKGTNQIMGAFSIDISDENGISESVETGSFFYSNSVKNTTLAEIFQYYRISDIGGKEVEDACAKVVFAGRKTGTVIASADKRIRIYSSEGKIDGLPGLTEEGRGYVTIEFSNENRTRVNITGE